MMIRGALKGEALWAESGGAGTPSNRVGKRNGKKRLLYPRAVRKKKGIRLLDGGGKKIQKTDLPTIKSLGKTGNRTQRKKDCQN